MRERVIFSTEPLLHPGYVQTRQIHRLARRLLAKYDVSVVSVAIAPSVREALRAAGIEPIPILPVPMGPYSNRFEVASYVGSWTLEAGFELGRILTERRLRNRDALRINFGMTNATPADIWWVQGRPIGPTLAEITPSLGSPLRWVAHCVGPMVARLDSVHVGRKCARSRRLYANSGALAAWYRGHGVPVDGVLPSLGYDESEFYPATASPRRDFILTYLGKETDAEGLRALVATGLPIVAFGAKSRHWVRGALPSPVPSNVRVVGPQTIPELRELYSQAAFTAFPFTEEPFGLVPVESMACGTPVLTYDTQGPGETVQDGVTGWLATTPARLAAVARSAFAEGVPSGMAARCRARAASYADTTVARQWEGVIAELLREDIELSQRGWLAMQAPTVQRALSRGRRRTLAATTLSVPWLAHEGYLRRRSTGEVGLGAAHSHRARARVGTESRGAYLMRGPELAPYDRIRPPGRIRTGRSRSPRPGGGASMRSRGHLLWLRTVWDRTHLPGSPGPDDHPLGVRAPMVTGPSFRELVARWRSREDRDASRRGRR
jgi:glycosyltransferase involved in cell wall biosynthesis